MTAVRPWLPADEYAPAQADATPVGRASSRTADPTLTDNARPTICPVCLTDLDDCGYCNCCARVFT